MSKKIAAYCLIISAFLIIDNLRAEVIVNHMMTKDPNRNTGCSTPTSNFTFGSLDEAAYCWLAVDDVNEGDVIKWVWYAPDSALYRENTFVTSFTGLGCAFFGIAIRGDIPAARPGGWHVDVFYNNILKFTENFTITTGGICPVTQIYGDNSEKTKLLRYVRDNVLNRTQEGRELIKLYYQWSPMVVQAMEVDDEFKAELKDLIDELLPMVAGAVE